MAKDKARMDKEKEKEQERKRREELNEIFKPVQVAQKVGLIHYPRSFPWWTYRPLLPTIAS
jgi:hypothetical protein